MTIRELVRPLPGVRQISLLRQRVAFNDSAHFWEENYAKGGTSGSGSYGALAEGKSAFLNQPGPRAGGPQRHRVRLR